MYIYKYNIQHLPSMKVSTKLTSVQESLVPKQVRYTFLKLKSRFVIPRQPLSACEEQSCKEVHVVIHITAHNVHVIGWVGPVHAAGLLSVYDLTYKLHIYMGLLGHSHITHKHEASSFKGQRLCTNFQLCNWTGLHALPFSINQTARELTRKDDGVKSSSKSYDVWQRNCYCFFLRLVVHRSALWFMYTRVSLNIASYQCLATCKVQVGNNCTCHC